MSVNNAVSTDESTSTNSGINGLFCDDCGSVVEPTNGPDLYCRECEDFQSPPEAAAEPATVRGVLAKHDAATHELARMVHEKASDLPFSESELASKHLLEPAAERARKGELVTVDEQAKQYPRMAADEDVAELGPDEDSSTAHCEKCDDEVAVSVRVQQTRSADESGTEFYVGACGHKWRRND